MTSLSKAELEALKESKPSKKDIGAGAVRRSLKVLKKLEKLKKDLKDTSIKNPHKKETLRDQIRDLKANRPKIIKKGYKGGLMVKPKAAKRGY